ncbi:transposase [Micromonospora profundi]|uniref:transposase n=1 Tax=Micromonospora profundi TaxID=1420889 RepID=UPI002FEF92C3
MYRVQGRRPRGAAAGDAGRGHFHVVQLANRAVTEVRRQLHRLATTIETRWPEILAFLHTGITNAGSEGTNRAIKTVARNAYGFRNPENQRLRTRAAITRRHRGHLNPA